MTGDLSEQLVDGINATYGVHPGFRAVHAKGVLVRGNLHAELAGSGAQPGAAPRGCAGARPRALLER